MCFRGKPPFLAASMILQYKTFWNYFGWFIAFFSICPVNCYKCDLFQQTLSISDFDIEGKVCVTGKVKNYSVKSAYYSIPVAGEYSYYSIKGTTDDLYIDNDAIQSSFGIEIDVKTEYDENNLKDIFWKISVAEEYGGITNTFYVSTKFGTWVQEQKDLGKWVDSVSYIRAYGNGIAGYTYKVDDCYKVELLV